MINPYLYGMTIPAYDFGTGPDIPPLTSTTQVDPKSLYIQDPEEYIPQNTRSTEELVLDENDPMINDISNKLASESQPRLQFKPQSSQNYINHLYNSEIRV